MSTTDPQSADRAVAGFTIRGRVMQTPSPDRLDIIDRCVIEIDGRGTIVTMEVDDARTVDVDLGPDGVILPGLVDTHIHAPQWPQMGTGLDLPLEQWLMENTMPLEATFADHAWATAVWDDMVPALLAGGTTTAVYYATNDVTATTLLAEACVRHGQRALVGRVAMDHPDQTPPWYRDASASASVEASLASIDAIRALGSPLVEPIITPRFAPSCTDALLQGLGELASSTGIGVQTHCSESDWEHRYALDRFGVSDTIALERFGLVRDHTVLAHCGLTDRTDLDVMRSRSAGVAHCPLSNAYFGDAVFPARRAIDAGVMVGLGSDLAGGFLPGLLSQCAMAVTGSRMLESGVDPSIDSAHTGERAGVGRGVPASRIDVVAAFWMATLGGASLIGTTTGLLAVDRPFDAFVVDLDTSRSRVDSALRIWPQVDDDRRVFEKIIRTATASDITQVWVAGRPAKHPT